MTTTDTRSAEDFRAAAARIEGEVARRLVGQQGVLRHVLICLVAGGHALLEGVPGLGKTMLVRTLAQTLGLEFSRIQFTPDLMPADIVGTNVLTETPEGGRRFQFQSGPVFANLVLADEINRATPKTQSALLEAMQERQVTVGETTHVLPDPFFVMATQNPIEQEGTYALPEAQLDRFMLMVKVGYPTKEDERLIMDRMTSPVAARAEPVATPQHISEARAVLSQIYIDEKIRDYIINIVHATREPKNHGLAELADLIQYGASPRASIYLNLASRAHAFLRRRGYVTPEDIKAVGVDVLRHRVILTYEAEAEELTSEQVVRKIFEKVEVP
ncbi:MAG: AAA family ATPase [Myxococcales bacterium]